MKIIFTHYYYYYYYYYYIEQDTDVMWVRNPFPKLSKDETEDLQISTDHFNGNPWSASNPINTGFYFIRSNNRTISLFHKWYSMRNDTSGQKEQDVLVNLIRAGVIPQLNLKVRFLNTLFFSGFCQRSNDFNQVSTVHANCCRTIVAKIGDLRATLGDWKRFRTSTNSSEIFWWSDHVRCKRSWKHWRIKMNRHGVGGSGELNRWIFRAFLEQSQTRGRDWIYKIIEVYNYLIN